MKLKNEHSMHENHISKSHATFLIGAKLVHCSSTVQNFRGHISWQKAIRISFMYSQFKH